MTDNTIKFCKDCKHGKRDWLFGWEFAKCKAFPISDVDLVTGKKTTVYEETYCETQRKKYTFCCGPKAKFFEPKKKVWWMT